MAKPQPNGNNTSSNSYNYKTWELTGIDTLTRGGKNVGIPDSLSLGSSNDFLYLSGSLATYDLSTSIYSYSVSPTTATLSGGAGSDQLIFKPVYDESSQQNFSIVDSFFAKFSSFEVLKVDNAVTTNVKMNLDGSALNAGIREVTGGQGNDEIYIGGAYSDNPNTITSDDATSIKVDGGAGNDKIVTAGGNDIITGGAGADDITGGLGADTFIFAAGDSGTISGTVFDIIRDYTAGVGGDTLNLVGTAVAQTNTVGTDVAEVAGGGSLDITASIQGGMITLAGDDAGEINTLAEWLAVARLMVTTNGSVGAFEFEGDTYVYQENADGDLFIQLDNVTGITTVGVSAANNTILVA